MQNAKCKMQNAKCKAKPNIGVRGTLVENFF